MLVHKSKRKGKGIYQSRGYTIVKVAQKQWLIKDKYNTLIWRASSMQWAKDEVDNIIQFMNDIYNRRHGQE